MKINNYNFKKYMSCPSYYNLEKIYNKKMQAEVNIQNVTKQDILKKMFDSNGNDLLLTEKFEVENYNYFMSKFKQWINNFNVIGFYEKKITIFNKLCEIEYIYDFICENEDYIYIIKGLPKTTSSFFKDIGFKKIQINKCEDDQTFEYNIIIPCNELKNNGCLDEIKFSKYVFEKSNLYNPYKQIKYMVTLLNDSKQTVFELYDISLLIEDIKDLEYQINKIIDQKDNNLLCLNSDCQNKKCKFHRVCFNDSQKNYEYEIIKKEKLKEELSKIRYPLYFLDFESYSSIYPRFVGEVPYDKHVFMYVLLCQKSENEPLEKYVYIAKDNMNDYRFDLFNSLTEYINPQGTIIVYNESFEKGRIKEAAHLFPQIRDKLLMLNDNILDLLVVLRGHKNNKNKDYTKNNYYNSLQKGSYSLKKVLPIFSKLKYDDLDIKNGVEASYSYSIFHTLCEEDLENELVKLEKYCYQDTYAMYLILEGIKTKIKT